MMPWGTGTLHRIGWSCILVLHSRAHPSLREHRLEPICTKPLQPILLWAAEKGHSINHSCTEAHRAWSPRRHHSSLWFDAYQNRARGRKDTATNDESNDLQNRLENTTGGANSFQSRQFTILQLLSRPIWGSRAGGCQSVLLTVTVELWIDMVSVSHKDNLCASGRAFSSEAGSIAVESYGIAKKRRKRCEKFFKKASYTWNKRGTRKKKISAQ
jgi:hypothetical protein